MKDKKMVGSSTKLESSKDDHRVIEIVHALYGNGEIRIPMYSLEIGQVLSNKMAGADPIKGVAKDAHIKAIVDNKIVEVIIKEGEIIEI